MLDSCASGRGNANRHQKWYTGVMVQQAKKQSRRRVPSQTGVVAAQDLLERIDRHYRHLTAGLDALEAQLEANHEMSEPDTAELARRKPR